MPRESPFNQGLGKAVEGLEEQFEAAVERSAELRESGASEDAILTQTAVAVRAAKALEVLTGVSWDSRLLDRAAGSGEEQALLMAPDPEPQTAPSEGRRRWLRKSG